MADVGPAKLVFNRYECCFLHSVNNSTAELCGGVLGNYLLRSLDMSRGWSTQVLGGGARKLAGGAGS